MPDASSLPTPEQLRHLGLQSFTAIDLETTGIDPERESIIEWGAQRFVDGHLDNTFRTFVQPGKPVPPEIVQLTGITDHDVADAPDFAVAYRQFGEFWTPTPVVGHHVDFDMGFLKALTKRSLPHATPYPCKGKPVFDTSQFARFLLPSETGYGLGSLVKSHGIEHRQAHRALDDAVATGWLFLMLVKDSLELDFQTVATQLRFLEGSRHPLQRFLSKLGNYLAETELTRPITRMTIGAPETVEELEEQSLPTEAPGWEESDYRRIFGHGGEMSLAFPGFEERPQQAQMAVGAYQAFRDSKFLCVEAGTGTGKSLAYLAPALAWAAGGKMEKRRVIISTGTKNLQDQLCNKDLPELKRAMPFRFRTALLKGRSNYLCINRWKNVLADPAFRLLPEERVAALPLVRWSRETTTGDFSEVSAVRGPLAVSLRSKLASDSGVCPGSACRESRQCFLQRARRQAQKAHVVVVNHALLFADVSREGSVLGDYDRLIVDEAHKLEKSAVSHLGIEWSDVTLRRTLGRLYQGGRVERGLLPLLLQKLGKPNRGPLKRLQVEIQSLIDHAQTLNNLGKDFAVGFLRSIDAKVTSTETFGVRKRYQKGEYPWDRLQELAAEVIAQYQPVIEALKTILRLRDDVKEVFPFYTDDTAGELTSVRDAMAEDRENFQFLAHCDDSNWVTWYETSGPPERRFLRIQAAPLDVSGLIYSALWKQLRTGILTSATLAVGTSFDHLINTVGLAQVPEERRGALLLDSPFDLDRQMMILSPEYFPSPKNNQQYLDEVSRLVARLAATKRGTLVLFTSYQALNQVADTVRSYLEQKGITVLIQGKHGSPELLLQRFRNEKSSVLFGTDSFWEGIDVVGDALEVLIVTKLPFDVPTDPWIEARNEQITAQGKNAFMEYSVPEAVIRLRQGVGRLIRTRKDRGVVVVADSRMVHTRFGKIFQDALPTVTTVIQEHKQLTTIFNNFWEHEHDTITD